MKALLIPVEGPLEEIELDGTLAQLQKLVGGDIEALPAPHFLGQGRFATCYVNGNGKFDPDCKPNMRATDFMVPGAGIFAGDYIAGPFLLCGFNPMTGEHQELPTGVVARARLIEREAG